MLGPVSRRLGIPTGPIQKSARRNVVGCVGVLLLSSQATRSSAQCSIKNHWRLRCRNLPMYVLRVNYATLRSTPRSQYALLFPGEAYERSLGHEQLSGQSPKESVWAIYCRSMLLWSSCLRQPDEAWSTDQRSRFALEVFGETRAIQAGLNMHHCNLDSELLYLSREFLFKCVLEGPVLVFTNI